MYQLIQIKPYAKTKQIIREYDLFEQALRGLQALANTLRVAVDYTSYEVHNCFENGDIYAVYRIEVKECE